MRRLMTLQRATAVHEHDLMAPYAIILRAMMADTRCPVLSPPRYLRVAPRAARVMSARYADIFACLQKRCVTGARSFYCHASPAAPDVSLRESASPSLMSDTPPSTPVTSATLCCRAAEILRRRSLYTAARPFSCRLRVEFARREGAQRLLPAQPLLAECWRLSSFQDTIARYAHDARVCRAPAQGYCQRR